jgi:hypothetical protein
VNVVTSYVGRWHCEHFLFLFDSSPFYLLLFYPACSARGGERALSHQDLSSASSQPTPTSPAAACYSCKIIFHFQTWGIGFNLCPVLRLAKWKLAFVMQINAELQKADKRTHAHTCTGTRSLIPNAATSAPTTGSSVPTDHVLFSVQPIAI